MTLPPWLNGPRTPGDSEPYESGCKVVDQRPGPGNTIRVTFALPGLRRAVVVVPEAVWLEGRHLPIGARLAQLPPDIFGAPVAEPWPTKADDGD